MSFVWKSARPVVIAIFALLAAASPAVAQKQMPQKQVFTVNPAQSKVDFTLGDVLHTVHGTFALKPGSIEFDSATGAASGELVVDAGSGDSGNGARDRKMKKEILETQKFPDITFTARKITGNVASQGASQILVDGLMNLHGDSHPVTLAMEVNVKPGLASADTTFVVPYVKWGLKNPSTFLLKVSDKVDINVHAVGKLNPAN